MIKWFRNNLPIIIVLVLTCFLYIWRLWEEGFANRYYSAGVYSMGQNLHAFFFNSLDSAGFISIDKPPLGFWIQVLSTKLLGFNGMAVLLPQAIAGVLSVYLIYRMIAKRFTRTAGIGAALVLALTPVFAAVTRNNTIDGLLILTLILASGQTIKAAEKSSFRHLLMASVLIGLGFNIKMLQAFMIVPAVYLTYLLFSKEKMFKRIGSCVAAAAVLIVISFSWITAVDLTPADQRPYVGSSGTNSAYSLAFGYNGINRLFGGGAGSLLPDRPVGNGEKPDRPGGSGEKLPPDDTRPGQGNEGPPGGGLDESGKISVFRLYNSQISGQASWFVFPALLASLFCFYLIYKKRINEDPTHITMFYFVMCFLPMMAYFSFSGGLAHRYYLAMLAFPVAALTGIALHGLIVKNFRHRAAFPVLFGLTAIIQLYIQYLYRNWIPLLLPVIAVAFGIVLVLLVLGTAKNYSNSRMASLMAVLLILPGIWAFTPVIYGNNAQLPVAGPELAESGDRFDQKTDLTGLTAFLEKNKGDAVYIACVPSAMNIGSDLILQSGDAVMALGGFNGSDQPLTLDGFKSLIDSGTVRYAVVEANGPGPGNQGSVPDDPVFGNGNRPGMTESEISRWIIANCPVADEKLSGFTIYLLTND